MAASRGLFVMLEAPLCASPFDDITPVWVTCVLVRLFTGVRSQSMG